MGALHELLTHLVRYGPARNPAEAGRLEQLIEQHRWATEAPVPVTEPPAQDPPLQGDPPQPAPAQTNPGGQP